MNHNKHKLQLKEVGGKKHSHERHQTFQPFFLLKVPPHSWLSETKGILELHTNIENLAKLPIKPPRTSFLLYHHYNDKNKISIYYKTVKT